jgi:hypothetical protein
MFAVEVGSAASRTIGVGGEPHDRGRYSAEAVASAPSASTSSLSLASENVAQASKLP